jgi:hypothetical protein
MFCGMERCNLIFREENKPAQLLVEEVFDWWKVLYRELLFLLL